MGREVLDDSLGFLDNRTGKKRRRSAERGRIVIVHHDILDLGREKDPTKRMFLVGNQTKVWWKPLHYILDGSDWIVSDGISALLTKFEMLMALLSLYKQWWAVY